MKAYEITFKADAQSEARSWVRFAADQSAATRDATRVLYREYGSQSILLHVVPCDDPRSIMERPTDLGQAYEAYLYLIAEQDTDPEKWETVSELSLYSKTALTRAIENSHPRDVAGLIFRLQYLASKVEVQDSY